MFECIRQYLDSRKVVAYGRGNEYELVWSGDAVGNRFRRGWKILEHDFSDDEYIGGEEWITLEYQFTGIENEALLAEKWMQVKDASDDISLEYVDSFQDRSLAGTPEIRIMICLSDTELGVEIEIDRKILMIASIVSRMMTLYEEDYYGWGPDEGRFTVKALMEFVKENLPMCYVDPLHYMVKRRNMHNS